MSVMEAFDAKGPLWLTDETFIKAIGGTIKCVWNGNKISYGHKTFITSHRIFWKDLAQSETWKEIKLDNVEATEQLAPFFGSKKVQLRLSGENICTLRVDADNFTDFYSALQQSLEASKWKTGGYEVASKSTGIGRIMQREKEKLVSHEASVSNALVDLKALQRNAEEMVFLTRSLKRSTKIENDAVSSLLQQYGLAEAATLYDPNDSFFQTARQSLEVIMETILQPHESSDGQDIDVAARLASKPPQEGSCHQTGLRCMNGMILLHELYCLYNRYPGVTLLSPRDFLASVKECVSANSSQYILKDIDGGRLYAVQLKTFTDERVASHIVSLLASHTIGQEKRFTGLSAPQLADAFGSSVSLAHVQLKTAERLGFVCRDESIEGLKFFENKFEAFSSWLS